MSRKYLPCRQAGKFHNNTGVYFKTFATNKWIDVFTRNEYKNIIIENVEYCQNHKGLELFAWCLMTNHVHLIARAKEGFTLPNFLSDF